MKPQKTLTDRRYQRRQKAIALVIVLAMVSMMTIFMLAIFSVSRTEHTSSVKYADGQSAKELADMAVNVVMAQIWDGTQRTAAAPAIWASQPGAIRRYNLNGGFAGGFKLYSSPQMQVLGVGEATMVADAPPADWAAQNGIFTDLNEPVIRPDADGDGAPELVFPIIDPRAYVPTQTGMVGSANVEGFWYDQTFTGVIPAGAINDVNARLPMPVQWLYVLKNGMLGTMSGSGDLLSFVPATSAAENQPSEENPIVGRIAFWTDDETSKININTAGEPTPWATPTLMHDRDLWFAHFQPMSHEYQRFPGHPATVALSSVMFPNMDMDLYGKVPGSAQYNQILQRKERIYEVMPKLHTGGSKAGTIAYWRATDITRLTDLEESVDLTTSIRERLYASVDDLMFAQRLAGGRRLMQDDPRVLNSVATLAGADASVPIFSTPGQLERARFFLTAHSRMPEVNMYGYPRVAIWPVADESLGADRRTGFDNLIAFCSSLGATPAQRQNNSYFFRRARYDSATFDINIGRNQQLLGMLNNILGSRIMPGGNTFASKYNQGDSTQILVQIFDYIRSTNLYDGFLAPTKRQMIGNGTAADGDPRYRWETYDTANNRNRFNGYADAVFYEQKPDHRTYTPDRLSRMTGGRGASGRTQNERAVEYTFPGHGSVVPSEFQNGQFRGLGRFPTITEVGFQFICTADGSPDKGSFRMKTPDGSGVLTKVPWPGANAAASAWTEQSPNFQGGRTAVRMQVHTGLGVGQAVTERAPPDSIPFLPNEPLFWYSNFPPNPPPGYYGTDPAAAPDSPRHPNNHPGYRQENWNMTLPRPRGPGGNLQQISPLRPGMKRVQGMLNLEICVPAIGYGPVHPEFTLVISGLRDMRLNGEEMFNITGNGTIVWRTGRELYHVSDSIGTVTAGGYVDGASMAADRRVRLPFLGVDPGYDVTANTGTLRGLRNFDLVTKFITVQEDENNPQGMQITGSGITIEIFAGLNYGPGNSPVQVIRLPSIGNLQIPTPELVTMSTDHRDQPNAAGNRVTQRAIHAPEWWSLSWGGVFRGTNGYFVGGRFRNPTTGGQDRVSLDINSLGGGNVPRGNALVYGFDNLSSNHNSQLLVPYNGFRRQSDGAAVDVLNDITGDDCSDTGLSDRRGGSYDNPGTSRDGRGTDVMFSILSTHGDPRHVLAKKIVPEQDWMPHPKLRTMLADRRRPNYFAHNIARANSNANPGYDRGTANLRLVPNTNYNAAKVPDVPANIASVALAAQYGDFDNGPAGSRDGGWINKPDEGNAGVAWFSQNNETRRVPTAYYQEEDRGADAGSSYMTPNRMMPSPVMFGSLPSRVKGGEPWRTLLFRPNNARVANPGQRHPGGPGYYQGEDPADHYLLDLFWMPVVEPYAISETFSSAGKVNINYQIVPFQHISRSTAVHAALKGELMTAVPTDDGPNYLTYPAIPANAPARGGEVTRNDQNVGGQDYHFRQPWSDYQNQLYAGNRKLWHRQIEVEQRTGALVQGTLSQFESRFRFSANAFTPAGSLGLFRTASQICEVHMIPRKIEGSPNIDGGDVNQREPYNVLNMTNMNVSQAAFWGRRQLTGDNTIERVYANLYAKITTQSNTFRVFYKAQTIRKARSVSPNEFDPSRDRVASEYRGTTLIERKLDANDPNLPNYTNGGAQTPLDAFYRFRVLETKRFAP